MPDTAERTIAIAKSHLDAYLHPETAPFVPLAPHARRTELPAGLPRETGGPVNGTSGDEMHAYYLAYPTVRFITGFRDFRWILDLPNCEATVFFMLDFDLGPVTLDIHFGQRFRVSGGFIEEIEAISWRTTPESGSCWPASGDPSEGRTGPCKPAPTIPYGPTPGCVPGTRHQTIATAKRYLDAMISHDASGVSLASEARRTEIPPEPAAGPVTGTTGAEIAHSLEDGSRYRSIVGMHNLRWFVDVDRCLVTVFSMVDRSQADQARRGSWHHVTRFLVSDGLIREIEDISHRPLDPSRYEGSCWPQTWTDAEDESYRLLPCPIAP